MKKIKKYIIVNQNPTLPDELKCKNLIKDLKEKDNLSSGNIIANKIKGRNSMNNSLIEIKNTEEIENKINNRNKTQSVKNTSFDLYERTKEKINKQKIVIQELEKLKTQKETQECTFKPVINKNVHSRNSLKIYRIDHEKREIDFFDRNTVWNMKKNDK